MARQPRRQAAHLGRLLRLAAIPPEIQASRPAERLASLVRDPHGWWRWPLAAVLFAAACVACVLLAPDVSGTFLIFMPAVVAASVLCGRWPATMVVFAGSLAGWHFLLPQNATALDGALPAGLFAVSGLLAIASLAGVRHLLRAGESRLRNLRAQEQVLAAERSRLAEMLERQEARVRQQETMFREMQHRVSNNMQFVATMLQASQREVARGADATEILDDAITRITSAAQTHRKLHDRAAYKLGLEPLMRDILAEVFAGMPVHVRVQVDPVLLPVDQMSSLVLLAVEAATNAIKHAFRAGRGSIFEVRLRRGDPGTLVLLLSDDGPGVSLPAPRPPEHHDLSSFRSAYADVSVRSSRGMPEAQNLGMRIMKALAAQLHGTLSVESENENGLGGTTVRVEFRSDWR